MTSLPLSTLDSFSNAIRPKKLELQLRQAVVTAIDLATSTVTINLSNDLDGVTIPSVPYLSAYTPRVNDTVWVFRNGTDLLIICEQGIAYDATFQDLAFSAPWVQIDPAGAPTGVRLMSNDTVQLRGNVNRPTGSTVPSTICTLDVKYRPGFRWSFLCNSNTGVVAVYVNPDGTVQLGTFTTGTAGPNTISLHACQWIAGQ